MIPLSLSKYKMTSLVHHFTVMWSKDNILQYIKMYSYVQYVATILETNNNYIFLSFQVLRKKTEDITQSSR